MKDVNTTLNKRKTRLEEDLERYKQRLRDTEAKLKASEESARDNKNCVVVSCCISRLTVVYRCFYPLNDDKLALSICPH